MDAAATPHVAFRVCQQYKLNGKGDGAEEHDEQDDCDLEMGPDASQQNPVCRAKKRSKRSLLRKCKKKKTKNKVVVEGNIPSGCEPKADAVVHDGEHSAYQPGKYNEARKSFLDQLKKESKENGLKLTHAKACETWDSSLKRARMLCGVSVSELKKRRFIPKGCTTNPFKIRVEESMND